MTPNQLAICTGCPSVILASAWLPDIRAAMEAYNIDTPRRRADFLANVGVESGGLQYTSELWGPTTAQMGYEGRKDLGNTQPGDGRRFRGHGLLQITGRYNHARVRDRLRKKFPHLQVPDFERYPEMLAQTQWAALSACDFCDEHDLNVWSDMDDFDGYCDVINRGRKTSRIGDGNGYAARTALRVKGLAVLS